MVCLPQKKVSRPLKFVLLDAIIKPFAKLVAQSTFGPHGRYRGINNAKFDKKLFVLVKARILYYNYCRYHLGALARISYFTGRRWSLSQQNMFPETETDFSKIQHKVIILYLVEKMDIPMTKGQIEQFILEEGILNTLMLSEYLNELTEAGYLEKTLDNNTTRYTITEEGLLTIDLFLKDIFQSTRNKVLKYVAENRKSVKQDFQTIANYFFDHKNNEYIVKCALYEDEMMLMELSVSVVTKQQAVDICTNWRTNVSTLYGGILNLVLDEEDSQEK